MATQLQLRNGTTAEHSTFTGAPNEVTVDTDKGTIVIHDGSTPGGFPAAREDGSNVGDFTIGGNLNVDSGTLFVDSANNRVGVGTSVPTETLAIKGSVAVRGNNKILIEGASGVSGEISTAISGSNSPRIVADPNNEEPGTFLRFDIDNSEAARIDSSGNLLVGTTDFQQHVATSGGGVSLINSGRVYAASTETGAGSPGNFNRISSDGRVIAIRKDGSVVGSIGTFFDNVHIGAGTGPSSSGVFFGSDGNKILPRQGDASKSDGNIDFGDPTDRFRDLYLSGGVYLGGTGSANYLDDYEEGTWTPTVETSAGGSFSISQLRETSYIKNGNLVTVSFNFLIDGFSGSEGITIITGIPFLPRETDDRYAGLINFNSYFEVPLGNIHINANKSDNSIRLRTASSTNSTSLFQSQVSSTDRVGGSGFLQGSLTYRT